LRLADRLRASPGLRAAKRLVEPAWYRACVLLLQPLNFVCSLLLRRRVLERAVLHISGMVHVPWQTTRLLRDQGWRADYLALGTSPIWDRADFCRKPRSFLIDAFAEFIWIWRLVARYPVVHPHFMITPAALGLYWLPAGRKIVVHWRAARSVP
jgi:hypothetical protein